MTAGAVEVVGTRDEAGRMPQPPLLVLESVTEFLDSHGLGTGAVEWSRVGQGQSNVTYLLRRGDEVFVLRRGPRPPFPPSTHDMLREARIQQFVAAEGIAVPEILAVADDTSVLGVPFYVMSYVDGVVITDRIPAALSANGHGPQVALATVDALAGLHAIPLRAGSLSTIGRSEGYLERQVHRFTDLWDAHATRELPLMPKIGQWLGTHIPRSQAASLVHGDYRIGNVVFAHEAPARIAAILDWEMATLGDPLADLGYFTATYAAPGSRWTPLQLTTATRESGFPSRDTLVERYARGSTLDLTDLHWYQALAMWKAAVFCEEIYRRWLAGERAPDDAFGPTLAEGVPILATEAATYADIHP